ncbi:FecR family protein [Butyricimonas paravirosa]|uniref:FecR family protein n=1 Tax=Butyricimonas paravirosa TaxID=1472417 RepID=UPI0022E005D0|nr:FecR domain-containing protein [Butyricimonas paravirosa]
MESWNQIDEWVNAYRQGTLSEKDRATLIIWLEKSPEHITLFKEMLRTEMKVSAVGAWRGLDKMQERTWKRIYPVLENRTKRLYMWGVRVAAVIIVTIGIFWMWQDHQGAEEKLGNVVSMLHVESGTPKAVLLTRGGGEIELKGNETRQVADFSGISVIQDSTGGVRFEQKDSIEGGEIEYTTIVVPRTGEYFVVLSDGTKVWMNSGSQLTFPVRFCEGKREVSLQGEAYFEVSEDKTKPFYVQADEVQVHVLGTAFNVMSYKDDGQVEVALLRGKVSFDVSEETYLLKPGEIASWERGNQKTTVRKGDVEAIIDWKVGRFNFEDMPLKELTVKLARWYGVDFSFVDEPTKEFRFSGAVTKYRSLDYVLNMISKTTNVIFTEENGKIVVRMKNK